METQNLNKLVSDALEEHGDYAVVCSELLHYAKFLQREYVRLTEERVTIARTPMEQLFDMKKVKLKYTILKKQFDVWMEDYNSEAYNANQLLLKHMDLERKFKLMESDRNFHAQDAVDLREALRVCKNQHTTGGI